MSAKNGVKRGKLVVISGPSGVGKSTICHRLCEILPAEFSVSVTTRRPREGEHGDRDYHYVTREAFDRLRDEGKLLEWAQVYGHAYGSPLDAVEAALDQGRIIILEIDVQGCIQVRERLPEAITVFLLPPTSEEQKRRIEGRNTDPADAIRERLAKADGEIRYATESGCYDEFIINDDLDETVAQVLKIIRGETVSP